MLSPAAAAVGKLRVAMLFLLILLRNGQLQVNAAVISDLWIGHLLRLMLD